MNTQKQKNLSNLAASLALAICVGLAQVSPAATLWWDGGASTVNSASDNATTTGQNWLSGGNWDDNSTSAARASWTAGDHAVFGGSAASQTITAGTLTIGNMTFGQGAQGTGTSGTAYSITNGTLTLSSSSIVTANTATIIYSALAGSGVSLTKAGTGTLTLGGVGNSFTATGDITVNGGTLQVGASESSISLFNTSARTITVNTNGTLLLIYRNAFGTTSGSVTTKLLIDGGKVTSSSGSSGAVNTLLDLTLKNGAVLEVTKTFLTYGTYQLRGTVTVSGTSSSVITNATGATGYVNIGSDSTGGVTTFDVADVNGNAAADLTISAMIKNSGYNATNVSALVKTGAGTLLLTGANTYSGSTTISNGTLMLGGSAGWLTSDVTLEPNGTLDFNRTANTTFTNVLSGSGTIKQSQAYVEVNANNPFSGTITIDPNTRMILLNPNAFAGAPKLVLNGILTPGGIFAGGTFTVSELSGASTGEFRPNYETMTDPRMLKVNQTNTTTYSGSILDDGTRRMALTKSGSGTLILGGIANSMTYTGDTIVNGGTLQVGASESSTVLFNTNARTITVNTNGTLLLLYRNAFGLIGTTPATKLVIDGGKASSSTGSIGAVNILQDLTLKNGAVLEVTKGMTLGAYGTYQLQGVVTVSGSSASMITNTGLTGFVTVGNGSNSNGVTTFNVSDVTGNAAPDLTINTVVNNSGNYGAMVGALTKTGAGTLLLLSTNLYTGSTTVSNGMFRLGVNNTLSSTNNLTLAGGILDVGSTTNTLGVLTLNADSALNMNVDGKLSFARSADASWAGKLAISGNIEYNRLRFGTNSAGLTADQLTKIKCNGYRVAINSAGYISLIKGTMIAIF
ncbi:MAG: autotransporter-associated beta strand repeat-containing protein [bacterium]